MCAGHPGGTEADMPAGGSHLHALEVMTSLPPEVIANIALDIDAVRGHRPGGAHGVQVSSSVRRGREAGWRMTTVPPEVRAVTAVYLLPDPAADLPGPTIPVDAGHCPSPGTTRPRHIDGASLRHHRT